eukprot:UN09724
MLREIHAEIQQKTQEAQRNALPTFRDYSSEQAPRRPVIRVTQPKKAQDTNHLSIGHASSSFGRPTMAMAMSEQIRPLQTHGLIIDKFT